MTDPERRRAGPARPREDFGHGIAASSVDRALQDLRAFLGLCRGKPTDGEE